MNLINEHFSSNLFIKNSYWQSRNLKTKTDENNETLCSQSFSLEHKEEQNLSILRKVIPLHGSGKYLLQ